MLGRHRLRYLSTSQLNEGCKRVGTSEPMNINENINDVSGPLLTSKLSFSKKKQILKRKILAYKILCVIY